MTDKLPPLSTPIALPSQPAFSLPSAVSARDVPRKQEIVEEEPYTIRCICGFADDDGNTIYCETCDTWQHIECYYPDNIEDALRPNFAHSCAECEPRSLDRQQAIARQRARTAVPVVEAAADKKPKRPPSKSHKKKPKPSELQINGIHHGASENTKHMSPQDNPHPAKKAKSSHKSSQSISSQAPKRSPSHGNAKAAQGHPLSPATTPPDLPDDFELHNYSSGFLSLYNDHAFQIVNTNSFAGLQISNTMSAWLRDPEKMQIETGLSYNDVFQKLPSNMDSIRVTPEIELSKKVISPNTVVQWQCLKAPSAIEMDVPLMEVNGQIGFQAGYCADPENRWAELTAPLPFVLFHPRLPLYIDTRREGSEARFVRRSCKPNAVLETYLSAGNEYHFWLVSDRQIAANEQITIPWDFGFPAAEKAHALQVLGLSDDTGAHTDQIVTESDYQKYAGWVHLILSEHGGCACGLGPECSFARFHRNYLAKSQPRSNPPKSKKRRPKSQHAISPTSTGQATNSRAASEGHLEDIPENDRRSVSASSRSKPPSRDMTPTARQGSFDTLGILTEPTDRDKRKVAMVEDTFRRMEQQQQQQPHRKRKRASDGTGTSQAKASKPNSATNTPNLPTGFPERGYVDAGTGTSRSKSGSPGGVSPTHIISHTRKHIPSRTASAPAPSRPTSAAPQPKYCDAAVQTDFPDASDTATPKRRVGSCLRKRMLENWHHVRLEEEERTKRRTVERPPSAMSVESHGDRDALIASPASTREAEKGPGTEASTDGLQEHAMPDARPVSPMNTTAAENAPVPSLVKPNPPDLRVEMPPVPAFPSLALASSPASTPVSAGPRTASSPFSVTSFASPFPPPPINGVAATPSPVKKKLSLSDYKSRMSKAAAARPSIGTTLLKPVPSADEPRSATSTDGGSVPGSSPAATEAPASTETATESAASTGARPYKSI
ncbi:hypothetical protein C8A01DRAFT_17649 [Parachaetomium inaequale]|uniref:SET domain-containing protein n=1 Tax=Parachaetomium inaequale TaxID=2588326 RepID=A0AAN6PCB6_9PEZI|nr:hypothetical protein C8A01DRAFT_17649 [Parachaetomium inaequale]